MPLPRKQLTIWSAFFVQRFVELDYDRDSFSWSQIVVREARLDERK